MFQKLIWFFFLVIMLNSCGKTYHYQNTISIPNQAWSYQDTVDFQFDILDTTKIYNLLIDIDHTTNYPFQNMYVEIFTKFPEGQRIKEMVSLELANRAGAWNSDCRGETCNLEIPIQEGAFFNQAGAYTISFKQFMRKNPLKGIKKLGLKIEDTGLVR